MPTPAPIDPIRFSEPRAVKIREPENLSAMHSAVHGDMNVLVESQLEAEAILAAWRVIMQAAADKAQEILSAFHVANGGVPVGINPETGFPA